MDRAQFLDMLRQYSSAARRKGRSYASGVNAIAEERVKSIVAHRKSEAEAKREVQEMKDEILREYMPYDNSYVLRTYD